MKHSTLFALCYGATLNFKLALTHNERGDFMPRVIKWKLYGKICFTLDKTHHEKRTIVT